MLGTSFISDVHVFVESSASGKSSAAVQSLDKGLIGSTSVASNDAPQSRPGCPRMRILPRWTERGFVQARRPTVTIPGSRFRLHFTKATSWMETRGTGSRGRDVPLPPGRLGGGPARAWGFSYAPFLPFRARLPPSRVHIPTSRWGPRNECGVSLDLFGPPISSVSEFCCFSHTGPTHTLSEFSLRISCLGVLM